MTNQSTPTGSDQEQGQGALDIFRLCDVDLSIHVYQVQEQGAVEEYDGGMNQGGEQAVMMAHHWTLPCQELEGTWDSLVFDEMLQIKLLEYVRTMFLFSDKNVNPDLISWNRYRYGKLLEINSHSLFSKWFSESGKMVQRMFDQIWSMVEDEDAFVCVLIDEVESLAAARRAALSGNEPSDSIRAVNALLTQIDRLKKQKNVLILTTSNITEAIDIAFIDRADIKLHIGLPSQQAIYSILYSSIKELERAAIIQSQGLDLWDWRRIRLYALMPSYSFEGEQIQVAVSRKLYDIAGLALGMSGRIIRKLPFLAHAGYIQSPTTRLDIFLNALHRVVQDEQSSSVRLKTFESVHGDQDHR
ncbi:Pachytene checkpoint protein 2 [Gamsiella multidivaricata]|nr:Pachytene checkpoint protein 2 [Gamsiella multidivaricata]